MSAGPTPARARPLVVTAAVFLLLSCSDRLGPTGMLVAPTAVFTVTPPAGSTQTDFLFDASGSSDPADPVTELRVRWDWEADGSWDTDYATSKTVSHRFATPGPKSVRLETINTAGLLGSVTRIVFVSTPIVCSVQAAPESGEPPLPVQFSALAAGGNPPYTYAWHFGDGDSSFSEDPAHLFETAGNHRVTVLVTDASQPRATCRDTILVRVGDAISCGAIAIPASGPAPLSVAFEANVSGGAPPYHLVWAFGDGVSSDSPNPTHRFETAGERVVHLRVEDSASPPRVCEDSVIVRVLAALTCEADGSPRDGVAPLAVAFSASGAGGTLPYTYRWEFGDGELSFDAAPVHLYDGAGDFLAEVSIEDAASPPQVCTDTVRVRVVGGLACGADESETIGAPGTPLRFAAAAEGGTPPYAYAWDFDDGATSTLSEVFHAFDADGSYQVTLTISDASASAAVCRDTLLVRISSILLCGARAPNTAGAAPLFVNFNGSASGGIPPYTFAWVFGDGATSALEDPSRAYTSEGTYNAICTVRDAASPPAICRDTVEIAVVRQLACAAGAIPTEGIAPLSVTLDGFTSGGASPFTYLWEFGDGASSTLLDPPPHLYDAAGTYAAVLRVTASGVVEQTCRDTVRVIVTDPILCGASATPGSGVAPLEVSFTGAASGGTPPFAWSWTFGDGGVSASSDPVHVYDAPGEYAAVVTVTDAGSPIQICRDTVAVSVASVLTCGAAGTPLFGSAPLEVDFTSSASGGSAPYTTAWSFGDGGVSSASNPSHTYGGAGEFEAVVTLTDAGSPPQVCRDTVRVSVAGGLVCQASASATAGVAPLGVSFTANAAGGVAPRSFSWSFGDGDSSMAQNPSHTFTASGTFNVTLTVRDAGGSTQVCRDTIQVRVLPPLTCGSQATPTSGFAPLPVNFTGAASGGVGPYTFFWSFGDGDTVTAPTPSHTFTSVDTFSVVVRVRDAGVPQQTCLDTITVGVRASPSLNCSASGNPTSGVSPLQVTFTGSGSGGVPPLEYSWSFGDGAVDSSASPVHTYGSSGAFSAVLTVRDAGSPRQTCRDTVAVSVNQTLACGVFATPRAIVVGGQVAFSSTISGGSPSYGHHWNFGDGSTGTLEGPIHQYASTGTKLVTMTITDSGEPQQMCVDTISVDVLPALLCSAGGSPLAGIAPHTVNFTSSASGGGGSYTYSWAFADGSPASPEQNPSHLFATSDTFAVVATIQDSGDPQQTCRDTIQVRVLPPIACSANGTPVSGAAPHQVAFTSAASGGVGPYTFAWAFGDGAVSALQNPNHLYAAAGSFDAVVTIQDAGSPQQTCRDTIAITVNPALACAAGGAPLAGVAPLTVDFTSTPSGGVAPYTFDWTFGDGAVSTAQNPTHAYASSDTFLAVVTIRDASIPQQTCRDTLQVRVLPPIACAAGGSPLAGIAPHTVDFTSAPSGGVGPYTFSWDFGDGGVSTQENPSHLYAASDTFTVIVAIHDAGNPQQTCSDTLQVRVLPAVVCSADGDPATGIAPLQVEFTSAASGGVGPYTFDWEFGDGGQSTAQNPSHLYLLPGTYDAIVTIQDSGSPQQTCRDTVEITADPLLGCSAGGSPLAGIAPLQVDFTSSGFGGGLLPTYDWDFGDGGTSMLQNPSHTYVTSDTFLAVVTVQDPVLPLQTCRDTVEVRVLPLLECSAQGDPLAGEEPLLVRFESSVTGGVGPYTFEWAFGDGDSDDSEDPQHNYTSEGTYEAILTILDSGVPQQSCSDTVTVVVSP